jgi:nitroreductase
MQVFEAVRTALAVRQYEDKPVPEDAVRRIIDAARLTGSSMNGQPWSFIVIKDRETLRKLGALIPYGPYVDQAPLAIAVVIERTRFAVSDGSRAIQSMVLTAWDEGIGSNWVGFMGPNEVKPVLGIPEDRDLLAVVPFGYPAQATGKGQKRRKPFDEVVFGEQFGQEFE